jgi:hypothetical protein
LAAAGARCDVPRRQGGDAALGVPPAPPLHI